MIYMICVLFPQNVAGALDTLVAELYGAAILDRSIAIYLALGFCYAMINGALGALCL